MSVLIGVCAILGILCIGYYGVITIYAGIGTAFAWFWICAGIGFVILSFIIKYMIHNEIRIPHFWRSFFTGSILVGLLVLIVLEGILIYHSTKEADPKADYLIVLGAQVKGTTVSKILRKRLDTAVDYLADNPLTQVIVSGGQGNGEAISEAEAMKAYLLSKGIKEDRILKEDKSTKTNENIRFSNKLMKKENP